MARREVVFRVSAELLHFLLKLPAGVKVTGFSHDVYFTSGDYAIRCSAETFPLTREGCDLPAATPQYRYNPDGSCEFVGWSGLDAADPCDAPVVVKGGAR